MDEGSPSLSAHDTAAAAAPGGRQRTQPAQPAQTAQTAQTPHWEDTLSSASRLQLSRSQPQLKSHSRSHSHSPSLSLSRRFTGQPLSPHSRPATPEAVPSPKTTRFATSDDERPRPSGWRGRLRAFGDHSTTRTPEGGRRHLTHRLSSTNVGAESGASPSDVEKTAESYHSDALKKGERNDEWERGYGRRVRREWFPQHHDGTSGLLHPLSMDDLNRRRRHKARNPSTTPDHPGPSGPTSYVVVDNSFDSFVPSDEDTSDEKHKDEESRPSVDDVQSVYTSYFNSDSSSRRARRYHWKLARCADTMATHVWHSVCAFFDSRFPDIQAERAFKKEEWYANKNAALMASLFLLLQWILTVALQTTEGVWRKYSYVGICGFCTLPLPLLVMFNGPRRFRWIYELWVAGACWCWGWVLTVEMYQCGVSDIRIHPLTYEFYALVNRCDDRNFMHLLAALLANASFAVMSLGQNRGFHLFMATAWFITGSALFPPLPRTPLSFWRNLIVFELYHIFVAIMAYFRERSDRQLFMLRAELKSQYRTAQDAQVQERRAEDMKKRFMSYIFHEVRVPLNTARLALANLDGEGAFQLMSNDQKDLVIGLDGSLRMMEKVLNDVLSFNRMESGNLTQARKPFNLHKAVEYVALSHRSTAELTRLNFQLELDPRIDEVGGALIGDEMRFKQVCSNLVSNAFKFTSSGGVKLVTKLLYPPPHTDTSDGTVVEGGNGTNATSPTVTSEEDRDAEVINALKHAALKSNAQSTAQSKPTSKRVSRISLNNKTRISCDFADEDRPIPETAPAIEETAEADHQPRKVLIRVEVHDTGAGISPTDVRNLFSPYVQTEIGRRQGGKGSGLGLALVSQIVKLSRGRLGVDSELGKGSVFWFEIPYTLSSRPCPPKAEPSWLGTPRRLSSPSPRGSICVTISQGRHRSAPDDPPVRCLGSSPLAQAPLFNVLPFSSPLERDPPTPEEEEPSPMSRPLPLPLAEMSEPGAEADTEDNGDAPTPSCSAQPRPGLIIDLTEPTGPCCPRMNAISRSHQSLLGRTPSLVPYQVPRRTLLATPDPLPILPQYPSPGSDKASPILDFPDPVAAAASASATTDADPTPPESLSVLVVDDDALTRKLMARMLRRLGHSVREAENGQVALNLIVAAAQVEPIDIVFLDNQMPLMTGVEVARAVRAAGLSTYIVGCTGNALREDQDEYLAAGADDIIPKPVSHTAIAKRLEEARKRRLQKIAVAAAPST